MYEIDPLRGSRWPEFLKRHAGATVFHSPEWLEALSRTYGHPASVITSSGPGEELTNGLVFCRVRSWLTGRRVVSVPFSDHCTPLVGSEEELGYLLTRLKEESGGRNQRYIEIRPVSGQAGMAEGLGESAAYCLHRLDLRPSVEELFQGFHPSCVRRRITRAEREALTYEEGRSEGLLERFYGLAELTRRRQQLPPQPVAWFRNLMACLGDKLKIRMVSYQGAPAAAILTLRYKGTMTYKYGYSDRTLHRLGSIPLLLWRAIEEAKREGLVEFDMGRTEWSNQGLLAFKDRWGAKRTPITYLRYPAPKRQKGSNDLGMRMARRIFALAPQRVLTTAGNLLYRHIA